MFHSCLSVHTALPPSPVTGPVPSPVHVPVGWEYPLVLSLDRGYPHGQDGSIPYGQDKGHPQTGQGYSPTQATRQAVCLLR